MNVVGQIFLVDKFLGGEFRRYGLEVANFLELDPEQRYDPMYRVFPKITKCTFHKYGPSGRTRLLWPFSRFCLVLFFFYRVFTGIWLVC